MGGCIFCTHLQIGSCDYKDELSLLAGPPSISAEGPVPEHGVDRAVAAIGQHHGDVVAREGHRFDGPAGGAADGGEEAFAGGDEGALGTLAV